MTTVSVSVLETNINASVQQATSQSVQAVETEINASISQTPVSVSVSSTSVNASVQNSPTISVATSSSVISATVSNVASSSGGTTNHAALSNLDYASSGHTGFQASLGFTPPPNTRSISTTAPLSGGGDLSADRTLSITQAGAATDGYLSSTDWNTFNNKQATLTLPLSPVSGGTGIANLAGSTLTLGGATTVPAPGGTVALLATANVFTAAQTIDLFADAIGLTVQAAASGTQNLQEWQISTGAIKSFVDSTGRLCVSTTSTDASTYGIKIGTANVGSITSGTSRAMYVNYEARAGGASTALYYGIGVDLALGSNQNITGTGGMTGLYFTVFNARAYTVANAYGVQGIVRTITNASAAITNAYGILATIQSNAGSIVNARGMQVNITTAGGTVTNATGLYVGDITVGGTLNYAIYTNAGVVRFGDVVQAFPNTTTNNAILESLKIQAQVSTASTGSANGFGTGLSLYAETATDGTYQQQGYITTSWVDATNATRKARLALSAYDTAQREGIRIEASGTEAMLGFYGVAATVRQNHIVDADGTLADATTKINAILVALETIGVLKTA